MASAMVRVDRYLDSGGRAVSLPPALRHGVRFLSIALGFANDPYGLLVGQMPMLLVEVFDLIWLVARDPAPVWLADFRFVVCHWGVLLLQGEALWVALSSRPILIQRVGQ